MLSATCLHFLITYMQAECEAHMPMTLEDPPSSSCQCHVPSKLGLFSTPLDDLPHLYFKPGLPVLPGHHEVITYPHSLPFYPIPHLYALLPLSRMHPLSGISDLHSLASCSCTCTHTHISAHASTNQYAT